MLIKIEPFRSLLLAFELYGFDFNKTSKFHKFLCIATFPFVVIYFSLEFLSMLQAGNIEEFTDRLLFIPSMLGLIFKTINIFVKYEKIKKLIRSFDEFTEDEKLLEKATKLAVSLTKSQFYLLTAVFLIFTISSLVSMSIIVPMFFINISDTRVFWFYMIVQDFGVFYSCYLWIIVDLLPISLMIVLSEYLKHLNESFISLKCVDKNRSNFVELINKHLTIKKYMGASVNKQIITKTIFRLCEEFKQLFSWTFFIQGFFGTFALCCDSLKLASLVIIMLNYVN